MPSGVEWAFRFASEVSRNPAAAVSRWKSLSGRKAAGGILPVTLWGNEFGPASPAGVPPFVCSVAGGIVSDIRAGKWEGIDAWVFPSTCDTFQNASGVLFSYEE